MADEVPGLTFRIKRKILHPCAGKFKAVGEVDLQAEIGSLDVWDQVIERLDGMTVHTVHDVAGALVAAAKKKAAKAEQAVQQVSEESRQKLDRLEAEKSFLQQDNDNLRRQLQDLQNAYTSMDEYVKSIGG